MPIITRRFGKGLTVSSGAVVAVVASMRVPVNSAHHDDLTRAINRCGIEVHRVVGPGLLEHVYDACLAIELRAQGLRFETQRIVTVTYRDVCIAHYRVDIIVEDLVVVEVK